MDAPEFLTRTDLDSETLTAWIETGWLLPRVEGAGWAFSEIDLARARKIPVIERAIMPEELDGMEQCFITGTAAEVTPVAKIADWNFEVGDITKTLMTDYMAEVQPKKAFAAA